MSSVHVRQTVVPTALLFVELCASLCSIWTCKICCSQKYFSDALCHVLWKKYITLHHEQLQDKHFYEQYIDQTSEWKTGAHDKRETYWVSSLSNSCVSEFHVKQQMCLSTHRRTFPSHLLLCLCVISTWLQHIERKRESLIFGMKTSPFVALSQARLMSRGKSIDSAMCTSRNMRNKDALNFWRTFYCSLHQIMFPEIWEGCHTRVKHQKVLFFRKLQLVFHWTVEVQVHRTSERGVNCIFCSTDLSRQWWKVEEVTLFLAESLKENPGAPQSLWTLQTTCLLGSWNTGVYLLASKSILTVKLTACVEPMSSRWRGSVWGSRVENVTSDKGPALKSDIFFCEVLMTCLCAASYTCWYQCHKEAWCFRETVCSLVIVCADGMGEGFLVYSDVIWALSICKQHYPGEDQTGVVVLWHRSILNAVMLFPIWFDITLF